MENKRILEQLVVLESIKNDGNVVMIKFDGEREKDQITAVVGFPKDRNNKVIQHHGDDLCELLEQLIHDYQLKRGDKSKM